MPRILLALLVALGLAGCNRSAVVHSSMPDAKPALATPPASVMSPNGY